jgi:hypothetical protein
LAKLIAVLERLDAGRNGLIYNATMPGASEPDFETFLQRPEFLGHTNRDFLLEQFSQLPHRVNNNGIGEFSLSNFRRETEQGGRIWAMPHSYVATTLRLYFIRWNSNTLIVGDGGIHDTPGGWQANPNLTAIVSRLQALESAIDHSINVLHSFRDDNLMPGFFLGQKRKTPSDRIEVEF